MGYANESAVGREPFSVELLKLDDPVIPQHFHIIIIVAVWTEGEVPQQWEDATIKVLYNKKNPPAATTERSSVSHMPAK